MGEKGRRGRVVKLTRQRQRGRQGIEMGAKGRRGRVVKLTRGRGEDGGLKWGRREGEAG